MLRGEQVRQREPDLSGKKFGERLLRVTSFPLVLRQLRVASDSVLLVIEVDGTEIFGQALDRKSVV